MTDVDLQHRVLETLTDALSYNAWLAELTEPHLGENPVEIGAGIGTFSQLWLDRGVLRLTVSERDPLALDVLRRRFANDSRVTVAEIDLVSPPTASHSALVAVNVLEHVEDDVAALRAGMRLVRPGGAVVIFVPAFPIAMSRFDRAIGHYRRYTRATLRSTFLQAGLVPRTVRYVNAPGLPAWILGMRVLQRKPHNGTLVRAWDRTVIRAVRRIERRIEPPFGQSVLGVAQTPGGDADLLEPPKARVPPTQARGARRDAAG
jgi:SAM-dependent methyltransferase